MGSIFNIFVIKIIARIHRKIIKCFDICLKFDIKIFEFSKLQKFVTTSADHDRCVGFHQDRPLAIAIPNAMNFNGGCFRETIYFPFQLLF